MAVSYTWDVKTVNTYKSHTDKQDPSNAIVTGKHR